MDRLQSMRTLLKVVDEGGFAAAARALDLSPAVVTRLVADLEEHLGARLLHRTTRRLALTEAGESYVNRVRHILQDVDEAEAATSSHTHELAGTLRLCAPPVLASYIVAPVLASFRARFPRIHIDLEVLSPREMTVEEFDLCLLGSAEGLDPEVVLRPILQAHAILVAAPAYLARRGSPATPAQLAGHDCLRLKGPQGERPRAWPMWREDDREQQAAPVVEPVFWANHTDSLLQATRDGLGITSVAADLVAPALALGQLLRVLPPWTTGDLSVLAALPSRKFMPQRTRVFLDHLVDEARERAETVLKACAVC